MKKILSVLSVGILSIGILVGCTSDKKSLNEISRVQSKFNGENQKMEKLQNQVGKEPLKSKINLEKQDILLTTHDNGIAVNTWRNFEEYSIFNDCFNKKVHLYKNNQLEYSIDALDYTSYELSPIDDKFIGVKLDYYEKNSELYLFDLKSGEPQALYFETDKIFNLIKWTNEGIYFTTRTGWEEMESEPTNKLYLLTNDKEIIEVWNYNGNNYRFLDVYKNHVLFQEWDDNVENRELGIYNLRTKEIEFFSIEDYEIYRMQNIKFFNSPSVIIGTISDEDFKGYNIFLFEGQEIKILEKGKFIGIVQNGFAYEKYMEKGNSTDIYIKLLE